MYIVYILQCVDSSLYTGITNDLPKRWAAHLAGTGGRYTRSHPVQAVVYTRKCRTKNIALKREAQIKKLPRQEKLQLISRYVV